MNTKFDLNDSYQLKHYQKIADDIRRGFYQKLRFYVLPFLPEKFRARVVFFPKIESFIKDQENFNKNLTLNTEIRDQIKSEYRKQLSLYRKFIQEQQTAFMKRKDQLKRALEKHFDSSDEVIVIYPVFCGPTGKYEILKDKIVLYPRFDRNVDDIGRLIILALTHKKLYPKTKLNPLTLSNEKSWMWQKKQEEAEKIYRASSFDKIFKVKRGLPTVLKTHFKGTLAKQSADYLKDLSFPIKGELDAPGKIDSLTEKEEKILDAMSTKRNEIVSFDKIADILWGTKAQEKFSLYAITKAMERLRKKLVENGINANIIHTQRGEGYMLYD